MNLHKLPRNSLVFPIINAVAVRNGRCRADWPVERRLYTIKCEKISRDRKRTCELKPQKSSRILSLAPGTVLFSASLLLPMELRFPVFAEYQDSTARYKSGHRLGFILNSSRLLLRISKLAAVSVSFPAYLPPEYRKLPSRFSMTNSGYLLLNRR